MNNFNDVRGVNCIEEIVAGSNILDKRFIDFMLNSFYYKA